MGPCDLKAVLAELNIKSDEKLLRGIEGSEDAAVYQLTNEIALVQTVDFFTPIVDDPYLFGQIAAANALSDIYAMGAEPITALNIVTFNLDLGLDVLSEIIRGGSDKVEEAGALIVGGHTVEDNEPKYGLAVTGLVHPKKFFSNSSAQAGDKLILTKPLGMGILVTALKGKMVTEEDIKEAIDSARTLNREASLAMREAGANSATDITGFGLLGHLAEMMKGSQKSAKVFAKDIPIFKRSLEFAGLGMVPAGARSNRNFLGDMVSFRPEISADMADILFDPETSGGLLISIAPDRTELLMGELTKRGVSGWVVGEVFDDGKPKIEVV